MWVLPTETFHTTLSSPIVLMSQSCSLGLLHPSSATTNTVCHSYSLPSSFRFPSHCALMNSRLVHSLSSYKSYPIWVPLQDYIKIVMLFFNPFRKTLLSTLSVHIFLHTNTLKALILSYSFLPIVHVSHPYKRPSTHSTSPVFFSFTSLLLHFLVYIYICCSKTGSRWF